MASTGYTAGAIPSSAYLAIGPEATWGTAATALTKMRFTSESLAGSKTRDRPNEIDGQRSVSEAVTTADSAGGGINFAASFNTFDPLIEALLGGAWTSDVLTDGDVFQSFSIEKKMAASQFFQYLGMYPSAMTLNIQTGAFIGGSFTFVGKSEQKATTSLDSSIDAAPTGRVMNSSSGVPSILLGGSTVGKVNSMTLNIQNQGAGEQRAVGSRSAVGINPGLLMASADAELYFKDFAHYDRFVAESVSDELAIRIQDSASKGYTIKLLAPLVDAPAPGIQAKDRPVMQRIQLMGNPKASTGKTVEITRDTP